MKVLIVGDERRYSVYSKAGDIPDGAELIFCPPSDSVPEMAEKGRGAKYLLADAIARIPASLIESLPSLRMAHSEGVGYEGIDCAAARRAGVFVCNCKGFNADSVAEQAILLMLGLLRKVCFGNSAVIEGRQMEAKLDAMATGMRGLRECRVGIVGLGDAGSATARLLKAFGCETLYYSLHRRSGSEERGLGVSYRQLEALARESDILSIHVASNEKTRGMVDRGLIALMKPTALLINTARGEIVDAAALREALIEGRIAGAGLDAIYPEPTLADNPLVDLPPAARGKVLYSPHFGGISSGSMARGHQMMWENVRRVEVGERPANIVNGM